MQLGTDRTVVFETGPKLTGFKIIFRLAGPKTGIYEAIFLVGRIKPEISLCKNN